MRHFISTPRHESVHRALQQQLCSFALSVYSSCAVSFRMWLLGLLVCFLVWAVGTYWYLFGKPSPFSLESIRPPGPLELDQKKRDKILKQGEVSVHITILVGLI